MAGIVDTIDKEYVEAVEQGAVNPTEAMDAFFFSNDKSLGMAILVKYAKPEFSQFADEILGIQQQLDGKNPLYSYMGSTAPDPTWRNQNVFDNAVNIHEGK